MHFLDRFNIPLYPLHVCLRCLHKGRRKKIVEDMSVKGGGGGSTRCLQLIFFATLKEKKNVLKRKNMYLKGFQVILNFFPSKSNVLDLSESIDMHIERYAYRTPNIWRCLQKTDFAVRARAGGGGVRKLQVRSTTIRFFTGSLMPSLCGSFSRTGSFFLSDA